MIKWRHLHGDNLEVLLKAAIDAGLATETITPPSLDKINIDTTVQGKAITYPADSKLYHRMREKLVKMAVRHGIRLRQSHRRVSKHALVSGGRYFHARQVKRAKRQIRKLKTYLRRVRNDIARKIAGDTASGLAFSGLPSMADRLLTQKKADKNKLHSLRAPEAGALRRARRTRSTSSGTKRASRRRAVKDL